MKDTALTAEKIRAEYTETQPTDLDKLKALDDKVKRPATIFAAVYGSLSAIVMGAGMSLVMTNIGAIIGLTDALVPGIAIGVVGMVLALTTYPLYQAILKGRKKKYAAQILELSEKLLQQ